MLTINTPSPLDLLHRDAARKLQMTTSQYNLASMKLDAMRPLERCTSCSELFETSSRCHNLVQPTCGVCTLMKAVATLEMKRRHEQ